MNESHVILLITLFLVAYAVSGGCVRLVLGRVCRTSIWCLNTLLLSVATAWYLTRLHQPGGEGADTLSVMLIALATFSAITALALVAGRFAGRTRQRI